MATMISSQDLGTKKIETNIYGTDAWEGKRI